MVLKGIRVLDFSRYVAGPYCAALLGDLGADVVRVERPQGAEDRQIAPVTSQGEGPLFLHCNRNKRGFTLSLGATGSEEIFRRLVRSSDIVVANMPESALISLGLDYDSLRAIRPDVILAMQTAFGRTGPYAQRVGFDGVAQAMSGATYLSGKIGEPIKSYATWADFGTAYLSALAAVAAVLHRERTGHGQCVDSNLLSTALGMFQHHNIEEQMLQIHRQPSGNRSQQAGPSDLCATCDGAIQLQVVGDGVFRRWCKLVGEEAWIDDPRFAGDAARAVHGELLSARMREWCADKTTDEVLAALDRARVPAGPLLSPAAVIRDPHVAELLKPMDYPGLRDPAAMLDKAFGMSAVDTGLRLRPPTLGEHTDDVLTELGFARKEIEDFRKRGVV